MGVCCHSTFHWKTIFSLHWIAFAPLSKTTWLYLRRFISGLICLLFCGYHAVLITISLQWVLKLVSVFWLFSFNSALATLGLLLLCTNFIIRQYLQNYFLIFWLRQQWLYRPLGENKHLDSKLSEYRLDSFLHSRFAPAIYFTYGNACLSKPRSQFPPPSSPPAGSSHLFSMSVSLCLPCTQVHQHQFPGFHVRALIYNILLFLHFHHSV